jgi:hypothetical protein
LGKFVPVLDQLFPNRTSEINHITRAYLNVRCGELPESRQEVEAVEAAWKRVRGQAG